MPDFIRDGRKSPFIKNCEMCNKIFLAKTRVKRMCNDCNKVLHMKKVLSRKYHITVEHYNEIIKSCFICGFSDTVDLHHKDGNHKNASSENLIGLCPNHHQLLHRKNIDLEQMKNTTKTQSIENKKSACFRVGKTTIQEQKNKNLHNYKKTHIPMCVVKALNVKIGDKAIWEIGDSIDNNTYPKKQLVVTIGRM